MRKLYRSKNDRFLGGVCGGIAEYLDIDSTLIRLIFIVGVVFSGCGFLTYLLMYLIIPVEED